MPRKLGSRWIMFWKIMRRDYRRSEMFYQCSHGNWNRCNNKLFNFIKFAKNIKLDLANSQGQKPPCLFRIMFSQPQCSTSQLMPKKEKGREPCCGERVSWHSRRTGSMQKQAQGNNFAEEYDKRNIFTSITATSIVKTQRYPSSHSELCFLKARAPSTGFWPEAWFITWN